jgi:hypothetical protein
MSLVCGVLKKINQHALAIIQGDTSDIAARMEKLQRLLAGTIELEKRIELLSPRR